MRLALLVLLLLGWATTSAAQVPPIPGRFGCAGYDRTRDLSGLGDLGAPAGGSPANNGFQFVLPARQVTLDVDAGVWDVELLIFRGTPSATWVRQWFPLSACLWYPEIAWPDPDTHTWLVGTSTISHATDAAFFSLSGYDGSAVVTGDFSGAKVDDGVLFTVPMRAPHLIAGLGGTVVHGGLWLADLDGVKRFFWAVYPFALVSLQPMPLAQLAAICACVP